VALTLTVTSRHSQILGPASVKVFNGVGGSIGRGAGNDWVLPDPSKFVSTRHAMIEYTDGNFYLCDTSTNGTFVNDMAEPVVYGSKVQLKHGDRILIGEYELAVPMSADAPGYAAPPQRDSQSGRPSVFDPEPQVASPPPAFFQAPPAPAPEQDFAAEPPPWQLPPGPDLQFPRPPAAELSWDPDRGAGVSVQDPLDIMRDGGGRPDPYAKFPPQGDSSWLDSDPLADHFAMPPAAAAQPAATSGQIPEDWDKTTFPSQPSAPPINQPPRQAPGVPMDWDASPAEQQFAAAPGRPPVAPQYPPQAARSVPAPGIAPAQRAAPEPRGAAPAPPPHYHGGSDAAALCHILEVAGMDPAAAQAAAANPQLADTLGVVLQLFVQGMMDVLRARSEVKGTFRLEVTRIGSVENNPLKFCPDGAAALVELFAKRGSGYLSPVDAVREAFDDTKAHQMAMMAGMQAAFESLMQRFNPDELRREIDPGSGGGVFKALNKAKYWDGLVDLYTRQMRNSDESFKRLFGEPFAEAYEAQMVRLTGSRRRH
jgi:type VI secretion system protein